MFSHTDILLVPRVQTVITTVTLPMASCMLKFSLSTSHRLFHLVLIMNDPYVFFPSYREKVKFSVKVALCSVLCKCWDLGFECSQDLKVHVL